MRKGRLITIGSFDGVHRGHAALLDVTVQEAKKRNISATALTFQVPPKIFLETHGATPILSTPKEKECLLRAQGINEVVFLNFNDKLSKIRSFEFFRSVLLERLRAKGIVVGLDFRFGMNRGGGAHELVRWGCDHGIPVWVIPPVRFSGQMISSTLIRQLMAGQSFKAALNYLGHPYLIEGKIVKGRGVGRRIGFPTANVKVDANKVVPGGVFVARAWVLPKAANRWRLSGKGIPSVCNIGVRPTLLKTSPVVLEVHFLEARGDFIGKNVFIQLLHKLRDEKKFTSTRALVNAIGRDVRKARRYFSRHAPVSVR